MAPIPTSKNNDERLVAAALSDCKGTSTAQFLSLKHLAKSRALMVTLLTVLVLIISSVSALMRPSHAADSAGASASASTVSNSSNTLGELAIKPKPASPSKVNKPIDSKTDWEDLTAAQKLILAPLASGWNGLKLATRKKWVEISKRFSSLSPTEQSRVQERMHDWVNLTPEQRRVVRENYARNRKLDTEQRAKRWAEYQQLPEAEKQKLAAEAAAANNRKRITAQVLSPQTKPKEVKPIQLAPKPVPAAVPAPAQTATPASAVDAIGH